MNNNDILKFMKNRTPEELAAKLDPQQQKLLAQLIADKSARERFLSSKEAQELLKMLKNGG